jgi:membrane protein
MGDAPAPEQPGRPGWIARLARLPIALLRSLLRAIPMAIDGYFRHRLALQAAGIAYRVLFSLAPLAIVLVSIAGFVLKDDSLRQELTERVVAWLPVSDEGQDSVEAAITKLASPSSALGLVSIALFAWAATGMMWALRTGLETAFEAERTRPAVRGKIVDFILVVAAGLLVIAAIAATFVAQVVTRLVGQVADAVGYGGSAVSELTRIVVPLVVSTIVIMLIYRFVPSRRVRTVDALAGAVVTGLLFVGISAGSAAIYDRVAALSVIYGSITAVLVFLYSMYLYASAILFGGEVAAAWSRPAEPTTEPLVARVKNGLLGLVLTRKPTGAEAGTSEPGSRARDEVSP